MKDGSKTRSEKYKFDTSSYIVMDMKSGGEPKWNPIETAQKDGTWIVAWFPKLKIRSDITIEAHPAAVYFDEAWWVANTVYDWDPTHWMSLPTPPTGAPE